MVQKSVVNEMSTLRLEALFSFIEDMAVKEVELCGRAHEAIFFNNDVAMVCMTDEWWLIDAVSKEFLNTASYQEDELVLMFFTIAHILKNGRTSENTYGARELLAANVEASDDIREMRHQNIDMNASSNVVLFNDFVKVLK